MTKPRTAAGRELVEDEPRLVTGEHSMLARVLAIEAEAASSDSEALRAAKKRVEKHLLAWHPGMNEELVKHIGAWIEGTNDLPEVEPERALAVSPDSEALRAALERLVSAVQPLDPSLSTSRRDEYLIDRALVQARAALTPEAKDE
jgi:hypothetical protein